METTHSKILYILLMVQCILLGCRNSGDSKIPGYAENFEVGRQAYVQQNSRWRESRRIETLARNYRRRLNPETFGCNHLDADNPILLALGADIIVRDRLSRESSGGQGCRCIPMGESCNSGTCNCDEICPNSHEILRGRANQMNPNSSNGLAFENSTSYNNTVFSRAPVTGGYCNGMNVVNKKFQVLSNFRPDLRSRDAMTKNTPAWREYIIQQFRNLRDGQSGDFLGVASPRELCADPQLRQSMTPEFGWYLGGGDCSQQSYWDEREQLFNSVISRMNFNQPDATNFPVINAIDPDTGARIPNEGTVAYQQLLEEKARLIATGNPATIPGVDSVMNLSKNPAIAEIMGEQIANDWDHYNDLRLAKRDDARGSFHYSAFAEDRNAPMTTDESQILATQARAMLPAFPSTYPNGAAAGESWNENGPFQTMTMSYLFPDDSEPSGRSAHSIEAWAFKNEPDGSIKICVKDPNHDQKTAEDDNCNSYVHIPQSGPPVYNRQSGEPLTRINFDSHNSGLIGSMTAKLVKHCRLIHRRNFRAGGESCQN